MYIEGIGGHVHQKVQQWGIHPSMVPSFVVETAKINVNRFMTNSRLGGLFNHLEILRKHRGHW